MISLATCRSTQCIYLINIIFPECMLQLNEMFNRIQNSMDINKSRSFYAGRFQGKHA